MSTSTSEAAILSTIRHITAKKWDKAASRLDTLGSHLRDAESALKYSSDAPDARHLEADVIMLLATVRKAFAGYLAMKVDKRSATRIKYAFPGSETVDLKFRLDGIERMLWETKYTSGLSTSPMLAWREELLDVLRQGHRRMSYTSLFGQLTREWADLRFGELSASKAKGNKLHQSATAPNDDDNAEVTVGRKEMYQQRVIWEEHVAVERKTDSDKITVYLDKLFHSGSQQVPGTEEPVDMYANMLRRVRRFIASGCKEYQHMTTETVRAAVQGVLSSDQLTSQKRLALLDISNKDSVLSEIAHLLKIDTSLAALNKWSWGGNPITTQMRKAINGKYRVYLDLELLDAILIQCMGQSISVTIRRAILSSWDSDTEDIWQPPANEARVAAMERQLPGAETRDGGCVKQLRRKIYKDTFMAVSLPKYAGDTADGYDDEGSVQNDDEGESFSDLDNGTNKVALKTDLLRLCTAEMAVQKLTHGQFCVLQSDFEWFGPSLPHSTILAIMKYFHFPTEIVHFLREFISMQMKFEEDGVNGPVVTRKNGIPVSFQLTDGISELLLFVLDFAVNQRTGGSFLFRNHDDLWFWGQPEQCAIAWETICEFTEVMGLRLNKDKTGSAHAVDESNPRYTPTEKSVIQRLPEGEVKWGFLSFDPSTWHWKANKPAIEEHMGELRFQLKSRTSVMAHIQAYNAYIQKFLPRNFGHVFVGLGDSHPAMVLEALQYAQKCLYGSNESEQTGNPEERVASAADHVRYTIQDRFGKDYDIPDCFLYMNVEDGGLGLANPVPAFAQYVNIPRDKTSDDDEGEDMLPPFAALYRGTMECISRTYREDGKRFADRQRKEKGKRLEEVNMVGNIDSSSGRKTSVIQDDVSKRLVGATEFMSLSDYIATAEEHSYDLYAMYRMAARAPEKNKNSLNITTWASELFYDELEELFGGRIVEEEFLSLRLYRTLAEEKVRWQG
ncbi:hypothetical protein K4F52_005577 [Lecanicillium sp. MT-2017a]|nr:hypothetical protein K4F52_005577 [Lecanicillium sp. MT-2017a]